ncbi:MAG: hypothetical protein U0744_07800 [Gemmataceae bacterium]
MTPALIGVFDRKASSRVALAECNTMAVSMTSRKVSELDHAAPRHLEKTMEGRPWSVLERLPPGAIARG